MEHFLRSPALLAIIALVNVPLLALVLRMAFDSWGDLGEALFFWIGPIWLQVADVLFGGGDWSDHQWESLKVVVLVLVFAGAVGSEYAFVVSHYPGSIAWAHHVLPLGAPP